MVALLYCEIKVINLAICWNGLVLSNTLNSKNFYSYTQSAGNPYTLSLKSPSETTREISRNYDLFYENSGQSKNKTIIDKEWLNWFIGFSEGDGAILSNQDRAKFVLTQKESAILYEIQEVLGFGKVCCYKDCSRLIVTDLQHILLLFFIFNGNLVLNHRVKQLYGWVNLLNKNGGQRNLNLSLNPNLVKPNLNDSWLSGFTDAEGCFNVAIQTRSNTITGYRVILRFLLDQKNAHPTLLEIKNLFGFGQVNLRKETKDVYRYTNNSFKGLLSVKGYFLIYPLKTQKSHSFQKWLEVYTMVLNKEHLVEKGLNKIRILQRQININNSLNRKTGSSKK